MAQYLFGSGVLYGVRTDVAGATPVQFGALQEVQVDISFQTKELYGQSQFPLAVARGTAKVTGKAKLARIVGRAFNDLFFGQTASPGQTLTAFQEAASVPAASPYTVAVANGATWSADLGVVHAATGLPLIRVASAPAAGEYAVSAGTYTFASGDAGAALLVSYAYGETTSGQTLVLANQLLGSAPQFQATLAASFQGKQLTLKLNACIATKLSLPTKLEDFTVPELDFSAFADAAGNVGTLSVAEAS